MRGKQALLAGALVLLLTSCAAAPAPSPAAESRSPVYTDWSALTPYAPPEEHYTRRYAEFTDTLIPADDYGPLIPFHGATLGRSLEGWADSFSLYGLVTLEGEVVADPVFSSAFSPIGYQGGGQSTILTDVLILTKTVEVPGGDPQAKSALCARDGRWCTDFLYTYDWELLFSQDLTQGIPMQKGDNQLVFLDPSDGHELRSVDAEPYLSLGMEYSWQLFGTVRYGEQYAPFWVPETDGTQRYCIADLDTGTHITLDSYICYLSSFSQGVCQAQTASGTGYLDGTGRWIIDPVYEQVGDFYGGVTSVRDRDGRFLFLGLDGGVLLQAPDWCTAVDYFPGSVPLWRCQDENQSLYLDADLSPVVLPEDTRNSRILDDGWIACLRSDGSWTLLRNGENVSLSKNLGQPQSVQDGYALLQADGGGWSLVCLDTGESSPLSDCDFAGFERDEVTGQSYVRTSSEEFQRWGLFRLDGTKVIETSYGTGRDTLAGGLILLDRDDFSALLTQKGKSVFRWNIPSPWD